MERLRNLSTVLQGSTAITEQERLDLAQDKLKLIDSMKTIRFDVSNGANIIELLTDNTTVVSGQSDFSKKTLNTTGIYDRILVKSVEGLTANMNIKTAKYSATATAFNKGLINSKLKMAHNGKKVAEIGVSSILTDAASASVVGADLAYTLNAPIIIAKGVDSDITIAVPQGEAITPAASSGVWVEVTFIGVELIAR